MSWRSDPLGGHQVLWEGDGSLARPLFRKQNNLTSARDLNHGTFVSHVTIDCARLLSATGARFYLFTTASFQTGKLRIRPQFRISEHRRSFLDSSGRWCMVCSPKTYFLDGVMHSSTDRRVAMSSLGLARHNRNIYLILIMSLFVVASFALAHAQQAQSALQPIDQQALAILQKTLGAMGADAVADTATTVVHGTLTSEGGKDGPQPKAISIQTIGSRSMWGAGVLPTGATVASSLAGAKAVPRDPNLRGRRIDHLPALLIAYELRRNDLALEFVGSDQFDGKPAYHVALSRRSMTGTEIDQKQTEDSRIEVFVDADSFLVLALRKKLLSSTDVRRSLPLEIRYSDYRNMNGLFVPFRQLTFLDGHKISELTLESVAVSASTGAEVK
jgi:hypothetical protein